MSAPSPLERAPDALGPGELWLKREDRHELGVFKWRGALPALEEFRSRGADAVVTASTGNHGAASAWAAGRLGMRAVVFVPDGASRTKVERLRSLGAELHEVGADLDASKGLALEHAADRGLPFFEDGAEPAQFGGYAAIGAELVEGLGRSPARVVAPVGNGALLIGLARGLASAGAAEVAVGVVASAAPVMALSVAAARPVDCDRSDTFADGIAVRVAIPLAVDELVELGVPIVEVSERAIARGVGAFDRAGIRVEGSAAAPLAALELLEPVDGPTVLIVTGRNIDDELHRRASEEPDSFPAERVLAEAVRLLRCPACAQALADAGGALRCPAGHSYDVARQGYVALALGAHGGDGAEMVAARERALSAGLFDPLAEALAGEGAAAGEGAVVELGAGTGWYLARVLQRLPDRIGLALDVSKPALRRAARAHPRAVAVGADVWGALPLRDGAAGLVLSVFSPRNADESARLLGAGGALVVVTPAPDHLAELVEALGLLGVEERKQERLTEAHAERFELAAERELRWPLGLDRAAALDLAAMGPSAFHGDPRSRAGELPERLSATASVRIATFRPRSPRSP